MNYGVTKGQVIRYVALPGIGPRIARLFASGFQHIPYLIALVYLSVRLLPAGHPYANPANIGRFGIRHVIGEAANHLVISRRNIDQIVLFISIISGLVIIVLQMGLLVGALLFQPAMAAMPTNFMGFFVTPPATEDSDIAGMMLDMVFGVPDIFNSCISTPAVCVDLNGNAITAYSNPLEPLGLLSPLAPGANAFFPFAVHLGLHQMFQLYSLGLLVVAIIISSYFVITVIAETAETGTAFGKRFNKVWAPIRFAVAFGLLIPIGYGLNSSQYLVLYAAKFGSGFATNGWNLFNEVLVNGFGRNYVGSVLGNGVRLVTQPSTPEGAINDLLQFMFLARTCKHAEELYLNAERVDANGNTIPAPNPPIVIRPYLVRGVQFTPAIDTNNALAIDTVQNTGTPYSDVMTFARGATSVTVRFGLRKAPPTITGDPDIVGPNDTHYGFELGFVKPICGELKLTLTDPRYPAVDNMGVQAMQEYYWFLIKELWETDVMSVGFSSTVGGYPGAFALNYTTIAQPDPPEPEPDAAYKSEQRDFYVSDFRCMMIGGGGCFIPTTDVPDQPAIPLQIASGNWTVPQALRDKGWAGAGIWYNRIAQMNGAMTTASFNFPIVSKYPYLMEYVKLKKRQYDQTVAYEEMFLPLLANGRDVPMQRPEDEHIIRAMNMAYQYWTSDGGLSSSHTQATGNIIIDTINYLLGTDGLYSMRKNPDVHPLAQLVGVGRSLVESSIRNLAYSGVAKMFQGVFKEDVGQVFASFFITVATIGLTAGFILYYVVPFLPFIYFFFAVGGWVKGIFEAMVGAPLWALAHIRIDGNGLSGQAAINGYFLLFEIFIRPILIIFGLLASIMIFAALVDVLNTTFDLVTSNLTGFDVECELSGCGPTDIEFYRAPVDEFFFTVIYAILVYLMGLSSFKLIDLVPNNILRWMGASVATFNDQREDPTQGMLSATTIGAQQTLQQVGGGLQKLVDWKP